VQLNRDLSRLGVSPASTTTIFIDLEHYCLRFLGELEGDDRSCRDDIQQTSEVLA
jgi:hypothetical protein